MATENNFLDSTLVAREALRLLHAELSFVGSITRTYSDEFAQKGAKVGEKVQVRIPNKFKGREGRLYDRSVIRERSIDVVLDRQKGVDLSFTSEDLTLDIDAFSDRFLRPAAKQLATHIEWDVLSLAHRVGQAVLCPAPGLTVGEVLKGRRYLDDSLAPQSGRRGLFCPAHVRSLTQSIRDQYNPASTIAKVYEDRAFSRLSGFQFSDTTVMPPFVSGEGDRGALSGVLKAAITGNDQSSCVLKASKKGAPFNPQLKPGDGFVFDGVYAVHPQTQVPYSYLKQFSVVSVEADGTLVFTPEIDLRGVYRNVSVESIPVGTRLLKSFPRGGFMESSVVYHPDAFAFVTADLEVPRGVDFAARESHDGISMRLVRDYDGKSDQMLCRFDVLYGYCCLDESLACRLVSQG
ncbi:MAG: P22 phage major capsid protein family protein [Candidatus Thiodiazotropha sp.]